MWDTMLSNPWKSPERGTKILLWGYSNHNELNNMLIELIKRLIVIITRLIKLINRFIVIFNKLTELFNRPSEFIIRLTTLFNRVIMLIHGLTKLINRLVVSLRDLIPTLIFLWLYYFISWFSKNQYDQEKVVLTSEINLSL